MKVLDVSRALEAIAPTWLAADWDNAGLLVGDIGADVKKIMLCIDATGDVLAEAARAGAEMLMAYHPVIFKPISRVTASESPVVYDAVRRGIAIYSMHTALDAAVGGTSDVLADLLGLDKPVPLEPSVREDHCKLVVFVPPDDLPNVAHAAFYAGAGQMGNYYDCAFFCHGLGSFCGSDQTNPTIGVPGRHEVTEELRLEMVAPKSRAPAICAAVRAAHSYEEPAIDVYPMQEMPPGAGMGRFGALARPVLLQTLINRIKRQTGLKKVLVANGRGKKANEKITAAGCCAGSAGAMFRTAAAMGAQVYLTGEMRHHDALAAAECGMTVICLGHSNSERIALTRLADQIRKAAPKLNVVISKKDRDPFEIV